MLAELSKLICCTIMCVTGFYIGKTIVKSDEILFTKRNIFLTILTIIFQMLIYSSNYNIVSTLLIFISTIAFHKIVFRISYEDALISSGIYTVTLFFSDAIVTMIIRRFLSVEQIRSEPLISILLNFIIGTISVLISRLKIVKTKSMQFLNKSKTKNQIVNIMFILLTIITFIYLGYNVTSAKVGNMEYRVNLTIMIICAGITFIYIKEKINYYQLSDEYDNLFSYVQNFEDWIEKEQLNRHEYKNQLAILRSSTKDKETIKKIDAILEESINIKDEVVYKLKELPTGGLKGLMYYKVAVAHKHKIKIDVDVSIKKDKILKNLTEDKIKVICNLVGIYFDNAIEAALETKKKLIVLEIYNIKDSIRIVISNSFKNENIDKRNERGFTTKGKGHGNGLYYAKNIIEKNEWIESTQEIIDDLYVQNLEIKKD